MRDAGRVEKPGGSLRAVGALTKSTKTCKSISFVSAWLEHFGGSKTMEKGRRKERGERQVRIVITDGNRNGRRRLREVGEEVSGPKKGGMRIGGQ